MSLGIAEIYHMLPVSVPSRSTLVCSWKIKTIDKGMHPIPNYPPSPHFLWWQFINTSFPNGIEHEEAYAARVVDTSTTCYLPVHLSEEIFTILSSSYHLKRKLLTRKRFTEHIYHSTAVSVLSNIHPGSIIKYCDSHCPQHYKLLQPFLRQLIKQLLQGQPPHTDIQPNTKGQFHSRSSLYPLQSQAFMMKHIPHSQFSLESQKNLIRDIWGQQSFLGCMIRATNPVIINSVVAFKNLVLIWFGLRQVPRSSMLDT